MASKLSLFLAELKRRKVVRVAAVYALVGLGVIEGASMILPTLQLEAGYPYIVIFVLFGFPIALVLAWALEVTPQGIQRTADLSIEQLAAQTPARWRASSWVLSGVGLVAVLVAGYAVFFRGGDEAGVATDQHRVAVLPLDNLTGDDSLDGLGLTAADWITEGLVRTGLVRAVPFSEVLFAKSAGSNAGSPSSALALTWPEETGATLAVQGSYSSLGDSLEFRLRIVDPDGTVLTSVDAVRGVKNNPSEALEGLQTRVMGAVAGVVSPGHELTWSTAGQHPPNREAHEAFLEGTMLFSSGPQSASLPYFLRAVEHDPDYMAPLGSLTSLYYNLGRYAQMDSVCQVLDARTDDLTELQRIYARMDCSSLRGDVWGSLRAARRHAEIDPLTAHYRVGLHAMDLLRPNEAVEAFARYDPHASVFFRNWAGANFNHWSRAYHMLGDHERELEVIRSYQELSPGGLRRGETRALIGLGRVAEAEAIVEDRLADLGAGQSPIFILDEAARYLDAHGFTDEAVGLWDRCLHYYDSRSDEEQASLGIRRGRTIRLLYLGRNEEAKPLVERLAGENPESLDDIGRLGVLRARLGQTGEAHEISETLGFWDEPYLLGSNSLWRARVAAALGDPDGAVRLLEQAMEEGWRVGIKPFIDPYLKPLRGHRSFEEFLRPKG